MPAQFKQFVVTWDVVIQMFYESRQAAVKAKRLEAEEFIKHVPHNLHCDVCAEIMQDPQICRQEDCSSGVCKECVEKLVGDKDGYYRSDPGARCRGKRCQKRFYARNLRSANQKKLSWYFWSELKCLTCKEEYLMDERSKHLSRC